MSSRYRLRRPAGAAILIVLARALAARTQPVEHRVVAVDPRVLAGYEGVYRAPRVVFTVTREGGQLFATDPQRTTRRLTLHQNGAEIVAPRDDSSAKR